MRNILCILTSFVLAGCVSPGGGNLHESHGVLIGLVMVEYEPSENSTSIGSNLAGIWLSRNDLGIGLRHHSELRMRSDCQVVFLIENEDQLVQATELVRNTLDMDGDEICVLQD